MALSARTSRLEATLCRPLLRRARVEREHVHGADHAQHHTANRIKLQILRTAGLNVQLQLGHQRIDNRWLQTKIHFNANPD